MRMSVEEAEEFGNALLDAVALARENKSEAHITTLGDKMLAFTGDKDVHTTLTIDPPEEKHDYIQEVA